ncbi:MAG: hypothetical protein FWJ74_08950 [Gemmatimonadota bacterium]
MPRRPYAFWAIFALFSPLGLGEAAAQRLLHTELPFPDSAVVLPSPRNESLRPVLLSAIVPGAGQYTLGTSRWILNAALEATALYWYFERRAAGRDLEADYRDLAWEVARRGIVGGERRDGDFRYYEALAHYERSGAFDVDHSRDGVQPETDPSTYNGSIWALARAMFFPAGVDSLPEDAPEYRSALEYYVERAFGPEFLWSWADDPSARLRYVRLIEESDGARRSATLALGLVLANHLASAVDAFVTARLRAVRSMPSSLEFESGVRMRGYEATWNAVIHIPWPER